MREIPLRRVSPRKEMVICPQKGVRLSQGCLKCPHYKGTQGAFGEQAMVLCGYKNKIGGGEHAANGDGSNPREDWTR